MNDDDILDTYKFEYYSPVHGRSVQMSIDKPESVQNMDIITEFANFLSAVYGYRITLEKK